MKRGRYARDYAQDWESVTGRKAKPGPPTLVSDGHPGEFVRLDDLPPGFVLCRKPSGRWEAWVQADAGILSVRDGLDADGLTPAEAVERLAGEAEGGRVTKEELLAELKRCAELAEERNDEETAHVKADKALLEYINDPEIREAFESWGKWYS